MANEVNNNDKVKEILMSSLSFSQNATYEGTLKNPFPVRITNFIPPALMKIKSTDDGNTLLYSSFKLQGLGNVEIMVNPDGRYMKFDDFDWIGKIEESDPKELDITKMISNFDKVNKFWYDVFKNNSDIKYSLSETTYNNKACSKVTVTISPTDATIQQITKLSAQQIAQIGKEKIIEKVPLFATFVIDPVTNFCYSMEFYSTSGSALASVQWAGVVIEDISNQAFYPPEDAQIIVFTNQEELTKKVIESKRALIQDNSSTSSNFSMIKNVIIYAIVGIAVLLIVIIGIIVVSKMKSQP